LWTSRLAGSDALLGTVRRPDRECDVTDAPAGPPPSDDDGHGTASDDAATSATVAYPVLSDDLEGYRTATMRVIGRLRLVLGLVVALAMLVPAGGWVIDRLAVRAASEAVLEALGDDADLAASFRLVRSVDCLGRATSGSAFALETGGTTVLVTNRHVVDQARTTVLQPLDAGSGVPVTGVRLATIADVAVLEVDAEALPPPLRAGPPVAIGQPVITVGFPGTRPTLREGRVDRVEATRLVLGLEVAGGASGSPVLDEDGQVVGQVYARTTDGRGLATPIELLQAAITEAAPATPCR
jgi:S1-C subfamily serine protease